MSVMPKIYILLVAPPISNPKYNKNEMKLIKILLYDSYRIRYLIAGKQMTLSIRYGSAGLVSTVGGATFHNVHGCDASIS